MVLHCLLSSNFSCHPLDFSTAHPTTQAGSADRHYANQATGHCTWRSPTGHLDMIGCHPAGHSPKHVAFWKCSSYQGSIQGVGVGHTAEHDDNSPSNTSNPWESEVNFHNGGSPGSGETCQIRHVTPNSSVAGLDLMVNNTYCKDQTSKVHP